MWTFSAAVLTVCGVVIGAYITNFIAEDFRRHSDRVAIAAALAGELEANALAIPLLKKMLQGLVVSANAGDRLVFARFEKPDDPIYNASIGKLGLLGIAANREISFTYQNIRAFRNTFAYVCNSEVALPPEILVSALNSCVLAVERAEKSGIPLLQKLTEIASRNYQFRFHRFKIEIARQA